MNPVKAALGRPVDTKYPSLREIRIDVDASVRESGFLNVADASGYRDRVPLRNLIVAWLEPATPQVFFEKSIDRIECSKGCIPREIDVRSFREDDKGILLPTF